jgi:hypothetical protein
MRAIGTDASLREHETELIFTATKCDEFGDPNIAHVSAQLLASAQKFRLLHQQAENYENEAIIIDAKVYIRDSKRDRTLVRMGAQMDSNHPGERDKIFPAAPSRIGKMGYDAETTAIETVLANLRQYPADDPVRVAYESTLTAENESLRQARQQQDAFALQMVEWRNTLTAAKLESDRLRQTLYGEVLRLHPKTIAEHLFRTAKLAKKSSKKVKTKPADEPT